MRKILRIAIYDDTREHCEQLSALLERELKGRCAEVEYFPSSGELLRHIDCCGYVPDVAFLGVTLWDGDGIALAEKLNELVPACRIIFLSDSLHDATEVYRAEHVWFILHDELEQRIGPALQRALSVPDFKRGKGLLVKGKGRVCFVPLEKILYLERDGHKTLIRTEDGEYVSSERPFRLLEGGLADVFIRSHMSYWVNREKIAAIERDEFVLCCGRRVPISRSWRSAARHAFLDEKK